MHAHNHCKAPFFALFGLLPSLWLLAAPALAGVIIEPNVHWIGPDAECDYPSIQDALDDIFDCGIFLCPPGINELRLSANYNHSGQVLVRRTFDIRGGYPSCKATFNGVNKTLSAAMPGIPLFVIRPGSGTIRNVFGDLTLFGSSTQTSVGGVINMEAGNATLTLQDSNVTQGTAVSGGGIAMAGGGNRLQIIDSEIAQNEAIEGGGIFCTGGGVIDFRSGLIRDNTAELSGGGVYLQGNCKLFGKIAGQDRQILRNTVTDSQQGRGAGIFALFSAIEMGAINSRTRIEQNIVDALPPLHDYGLPGNNRGGGVHLEFADGTFYNTWFRGNEAADGGAISAVGDSTLLVDRTSGPCAISDDGNSPDCSLFEFNRARGGTDSQGDEGGDGAVLLVLPSLGFTPTATINRTTIRTNFASCYEDKNAPIFTGECDIDTGPNDESDTSILFGSALNGSLFYGNSIGDDDDCIPPFAFCRKIGRYFVGSTEFNENTVAANKDADYVFEYEGPGELINNIIWDFAPDEGIRFSGIGTDISSCNISNFAEEFDDGANLIPERGLSEDPLFINPDLSSPNEDFRVQVPDSPAIDRCDDEGGRLTLTYDIVGNPRPMNIPGVSNGSGQRDAGAFEALPAGAVNNTTDLAVDIRSTEPKNEELFEPHAFTIEVTNTGRNSPSAFAVQLSFDPAGTIESLIGANDPISNEPRWDCDAVTARCDSLSGLAPGGTTLPITLMMSYPSSGLKTVTATGLMQDASLTELNPGNNVASDTVTVGPGADVTLSVNSEAPKEVGLNEPQRFFVSVHNNGPEIAGGVAVQLDLGTSNGQIDLFEAANWDCNISSARCTRLTPLGLGIVNNIFVDIHYAEAGRKTLAATVSATDGDPNPDNNSDEDFVDVVALADALFADGFEN